MAERPAPAIEPQSPRPRGGPRWSGHGLGLAGALVVLVVTTVAAAWFTTVHVAPGLRPPLTEAADPQNPSTASAEPGSPEPAAKPVRQARARKPAPIAEAPSGTATVPLALPKAAPDEVVVIDVPKAGEGPVLSATDEGVTPPVLVAPRLNTPLQQDEGGEGLSTIDLVISDKGEVESVKLASAVRDYREAMMLSAVKAWRFKPATVAGLPVRYRLRIHISVTSIASANR